MLDSVYCNEWTIIFVKFLQLPVIDFFSYSVIMKLFQWVCLEASHLKESIFWSFISLPSWKQQTDDSINITPRPQKVIHFLHTSNHILGTIKILMKSYIQLRLPWQTQMYSCIQLDTVHDWYAKNRAVCKIYNLLDKYNTFRSQKQQ